MDDSLRYFLNPKSVAVIGVSPNPSYINQIFRQFVTLQTPPTVYAINPNYPEVAGIKCYPRLSEALGAIELVLVSVPARLVPDALQQCEQKQVKAVNIISSGFAEMGGAEGAQRQQLLTDFVARTGIRVVGPNCYGNASAIFKYAGMPDTAELVMRPGRLSLAFQSGGLAVTLITNCMDRHMDFAHVFTTGNEADVDVADCVRYFGADEATFVIGCYVEQFRKPQEFLAAAELCAEAGKAVVVLKSGRSTAAQQMAQAHTGALAGPDSIIDAALAKVGVIRVYALNEMIETLAIMHSRKLPKGRGVAALTTSGGENAVLVDLAADIGVWFPPFTPDAAAIVRKELYEYVSVTNPLDITGPNGPDDQHVHAAALDTMGSDPNIHIILHQLTANTLLDAQTPNGKTLLAAMAKYPDKVWLRSARMSGTFRDKPTGEPELSDPRHELNGVPFMMGLDHVLRAIKHLIEYAEFQQRRAQRAQAPQRPAPDGGRRVKARGIVQAARGQALTEAAGKQILALYGIPITRECLVTSADDAAQNARMIGFPVALKIVSPQLPHKTEAGGVALNVQNEDEARTAFERIMQSARRYNPTAELQGVSVQEMVGRGQEMIVGMTRDPQFGMGIVLGLGGIFVEVLKDIVMRAPPIDADEARAMVDSLKGKAVLQGTRGAKPADIGALVDVLQKFSQLCLDLKDDVQEIDINPLVVREEGQGAKALDCLIVPLSAPVT